ncbi:hypothetical protein NPIL_168951 [Nephila pilipes]|uniref:Uncharacterized protein n=1 Tax=Nephila pilipes TaxID=299642 RepID=A0A8X6U6K1_NEPPI|nr:hypothetical protein NPIL_168951 [Nephila pilipes]
MSLQRREERNHGSLKGLTTKAVLFTWWGDTQLFITPPLFLSGSELNKRSIRTLWGDRGRIGVLSSYCKFDMGRRGCRYCEQSFPLLEKVSPNSFRGCIYSQRLSFTLKILQYLLHVGSAKTKGETAQM